MAVTGSITTRFIDEKGVDLGKTLIEKDYLISVYPNLVNQLDTPMLMVVGRNANGELGDNTTSAKSSPIQTIAYGNNWKQIECNYIHTTGIKTDGTLWCWGFNTTYGQLGDNTTASRSSPVQTVAFGTNWKKTSAGNTHTAALETDGRLWTWGRNTFGQLGDNTATSRSSPVQTVAFGTNWLDVSCGNQFTAAVKNDKTLWLWGRNNFGQIGDNAATATNRSSPVQTVTFGTNWQQVSAGYAHTACIKLDGTLWLWGRNTNGQLGDNTVTHRSSPVQTIAFGTNWKQVNSGYASTAAIKTDGTLWVWGKNTNGELGDNTVTSRSSPIQTVAYGTIWKKVVCGYKHMASIKTNGTLWAWGSNVYGQLGDNTITSRSSPVQTVIGGITWKNIAAASSERTFAIKDGDF